MSYYNKNKKKEEEKKTSPKSTFTESIFPEVEKEMESAQPLPISDKPSRKTVERSPSISDRIKDIPKGKASIATRLAIKDIENAIKFGRFLKASYLYSSLASRIVNNFLHHPEIVKDGDFEALYEIGKKLKKDIFDFQQSSRTRKCGRRKINK